MGATITKVTSKISIKTTTKQFIKMPQCERRGGGTTNESSNRTEILVRGTHFFFGGVGGLREWVSGGSEDGDPARHFNKTIEIN